MRYPGSSFSIDRCRDCQETLFPEPPHRCIGYQRLSVRPYEDVPARVQEIAAENEISIAYGSDFHIRNDAGPFIRLAFG